MKYSKKELLFYWDLVNKTKILFNKNIDIKPVVDVRYETYQVGPDEVIVYYYKNKIVITINGTDGDPKEWRSNLDTYPITHGVHHGYYEAALHVLKVLKKIIFSTSLPIYIIGHSRGGGIAQVLSDILFESYKLDPHCITYGSIRPFTWKKAKKCRFDHHQVFCKGDPFTRIPPVFAIPFFKTYKSSYTKIRPERGTSIVDRHKNYGKMIKLYLKD